MTRTEFPVGCDGVLQGPGLLRDTSGILVDGRGLPKGDDYPSCQPPKREPSLGFVKGNVLRAAAPGDLKASQNSHWSRPSNSTVLCAAVDRQ